MPPHLNKNNFIRNIKYNILPSIYKLTVCVQSQPLFDLNHDLKYSIETLLPFSLHLFAIVERILLSKLDGKSFFVNESRWIVVYFYLPISPLFCHMVSNTNRIYCEWKFLDSGIFFLLPKRHRARLVEDIIKITHSIVNYFQALIVKTAGFII